MSENWKLDQGYHLDQEHEIELLGELEFSIDSPYENVPFRDLEIVIYCELEIDIVHSLPINLLPLIPEKFHSSEILQAFVKECNVQFGSVLSKNLDIVKLLGPNTASNAEYLRNLGALIGVVFPPEDESNVTEIRKILSQAVDWYKLKGSYQSVEQVSMIQSFSINLYDMYTKDYASFLLTDWFVGEENENPPGLDNTYYKSPHFGMEVLLNQIYLEGSQNYLWYRDYLDNLVKQVEETRPVHTVPHFLLLLNPHTDELGHTITVDGDIKTKVTANWEFGIKYFDALEVGDQWSFDDGTTYFDNNETTWIKSITKWVFGSGNYPGILDSTINDVQISVLTGTIDIDDIVIYDDHYAFEFIVPKIIEQLGLSELGLYIPNVVDTLVVLSCFPKIDKTNVSELRVIVEIYKKDLTV